MIFFSRNLLKFKINIIPFFVRRTNNWTCGQTIKNCATPLFKNFSVGSFSSRASS